MGRENIYNTTETQKTHTKINEKIIIFGIFTCEMKLNLTKY
jgi:hypothetical protein